MTINCGMQPLNCWRSKPNGRSGSSSRWGVRRSCFLTSRRWPGSAPLNSSVFHGKISPPVWARSSLPFTRKEGLPGCMSAPIRTGPCCLIRMSISLILMLTHISIASFCIAQQIRQFINSGRILAWGIVPTLNREDIEKETVDSLVQAWQEKTGQIESLGIDRKAILAQSIITPSCGAGSLSLALARKVLSLTKQLSDRIRHQL